jgi:hypothetical protein
MRFLETQPGIDFVPHDVSTPASEALLRVVADQFGLPEEDLGVPLFVRGARYLIGFDTPETTGRELLALTGGEAGVMQSNAQEARIRLPLLGEIDPTRYSLLALTMLMGLADGFNPCAMWVPVYLISLIAGLQDQRKIRWLVGTFVLASGILYFLFMTAWLNTFLVIGYVRPLTQAIGLCCINLGSLMKGGLSRSRPIAPVQASSLSSRDHPVMRALVLQIWHQLSRSRRDDAGAWCHGRPIYDLSVGSALRARDREAGPPILGFPFWFVARG